MHLDIERPGGGGEAQLDLGFLRGMFPALDGPPGGDWAFFDNAGGTHMSRPVLTRTIHYLSTHRVQPHGPNPLAGPAGDEMDRGRATLAALLDIDQANLTIGPSTTQNLNTLAQSLDGLVAPGDEVVVSRQEHEANIGCWERLCRRRGAILRFWEVDSGTGELEPGGLERLLGDRTRVVAVTHSSNIVGTVHDLGSVSATVHGAGVVLVADGVSYAPHRWPDVAATGADVYCFSLYKTFGPHLGAMVVSEELLERVEPQCHYFNAPRSGTRLDAAGPQHCAIASLVGLGDFFDALYEHHFGPAVDPDTTPAQRAGAVGSLLQAHETAVAAPLAEFLVAAADRGLRLLGRPTMTDREANFSFLVSGRSSASLVAELGRRGLAAKNGHFYARRLLEAVGIDDVDDGVVRLSLAAYNTPREVALLIAALDSILR